VRAADITLAHTGATVTVAGRTGRLLGFADGGGTNYRQPQPWRVLVLLPASAPTAVRVVVPPDTTVELAKETP